MTDPDSKWSQLSSSLRDSGVVEKHADLTPPPGFATRVVARARVDSRADATGLRLWRQWSLAGACAAALACGTLFILRPPPEIQIVPVPVLEDLGLSSPSQS